MTSDWLNLIFQFPLTHCRLESNEQQFFAYSVVFLNFFKLLTVPRRAKRSREDENLQLEETTRDLQTIAPAARKRKKTIAMEDNFRAQ